MPSHGVRRFACVSDRAEFDDLVTEVPATSDERSIRSARKTGQTYSVTIGDDIIRAGRPVRIKHLYRTTVSQAGYFLFIKVPQPVMNVSFRLDYTDANVSRSASWTWSQVAIVRRSCTCQRRSTLES